MHGRIFLDKDKIACAVFTRSLGFIKGCDVEECGFGSMISFTLHRVHGFIS